MYSGSKFALEAFSPKRLYHELKPIQMFAYAGWSLERLEVKFSEKVDVGSGEWPGNMRDITKMMVEAGGEVAGEWCAGELCFI